MTPNRSPVTDFRALCREGFGGRGCGDRVAVWDEFRPDGAVSMAGQSEYAGDTKWVFGAGWAGVSRRSCRRAGSPVRQAKSRDCGRPALRGRAWADRGPKDTRGVARRFRRGERRAAQLLFGETPAGDCSPMGFSVRRTRPRCCSIRRSWSGFSGIVGGLSVCRAASLLSLAECERARCLHSQRQRCA